MCDSFIALPKVTHDGSLLLAKNSDREPDEAQALLHTPRRKNNEASLPCTYIEIPQAAESYECILSKPFQMWGAEMGANEWGLVIGNEAVFTKVKFEKHNHGLTGMDLLRLALERCKTASEAIACITSLLEQYGQNARGGYKNAGFYYHNSFLIADTQSAYVLETAGKEWAAERVQDFRSISNRLSIDSEADQLSGSAKEFARKKGWWDGKSPFSFQKSYSDWLYTRMGRAALREACTASMSRRKIGRLDVADCIDILQTHNLEDRQFKPSAANTASVCMHATGLLNPSQTTGSMVAKIRTGLPHTIWLTGTSMPCVSVYLPFFFGTASLASFNPPSANSDDSFWWRAETLHRWICKDYQKRMAIIGGRQNELQQHLIKKEAELMKSNADPASLEAFSNECIEMMNHALMGWSVLSAKP